MHPFKRQKMVAWNPIIVTTIIGNKKIALRGLSSTYVMSCLALTGNFLEKSKLIIRSVAKIYLPALLELGHHLGDGTFCGKKLWSRHAYFGVESVTPTSNPFTKFPDHLLILIYRYDPRLTRKEGKSSKCPFPGFSYTRCQTQVEF